MPTTNDSFEFKFRGAPKAQSYLLRSKS